MTVEAGISTNDTITFGSAWADHDSDGDPDLFVNRHWMPPWLYISGGSTFRRSKQRFIHLPGYVNSTPDEIDRHQCMWGEANGDGSPDLYCAVGAQQGEGTGANQLVVRRGRDWVDIGRKLGLANDFGRGRSLNWIDYDVDGDLDLFLANGLRSGHPNSMFENQRSTFSRVSVGVDEEIRSLTSTWADWDIDGDPDLLVMRGGITGCCPFRPRAYENVQGRFVSRSIAGITDRSWTSAAWSDHDDDGKIDVALVGPKRVAILVNTGQGFATVYEAKLRFGHSVVWLDAENDGDLDLFVVQGATGEPSGPASNRADLFVINQAHEFRALFDPSLRGPRSGNGEAAIVSDFDRDGRVDLFVTNGNDPSGWEGRGTLLRNITRAGNWAGVDLHGGRWNPLAIGAQMWVTIGRRSYWRFVGDGAGYKSQSEIGYVHLGLGKATSAQVEVEWPGGSRDCLEVTAGRISSLRRGSSPCRASPS